MYEFTYNRAASVDEAAALLRKSTEASLLAGGMSLIPTMKLRLASPSDLFDLAGIGELRGIKVDGGTVTIGAMTTHYDVAYSSDVQGAIAALADLAGRIGDPMVRHRGTIGGSIANNDPASDYPAGIVGLDATVTTNKRSIAADDFFTGLFENALEDGEIVTSVSFPTPKRAAYMKFPQPASRFAMVGVFVAETGGGVRVAVTGAGPCVFRVADMESALAKNFSADAIASVSVSPDGLNSDIHAGADYRAHLIGVMARRAVAAAG